VGRWVGGTRNEHFTMQTFTFNGFHCRCDFAQRMTPRKSSIYIYIVMGLHSSKTLRQSRKIVNILPSYKELKNTNYTACNVMYVHNTIHISVVLRRSRRGVVHDTMMAI